MEVYEPRPRELALEYLEAYILEHHVSTHDALPPERELCQKWQISRSTLRSAISHMIASGQLYAIQGSGTYVSPRVRRNLQDLESFTSFAHRQGMKASSRLLSFSCIAADEGLAREFGDEAGLLLYQIVRLRCINDLPLLIESSYIPKSLAPHLEAHDIVSASLYDILEKNYGLKPSHGWEKVSATSASAEEAHYLEIPENSTVFWLISKTSSPDGALFEYCRTVGRSDRLEFCSTLRWRKRNEPS